MRTEKQMYDLILGFANKDERVRAVILNGSRANPGAPRDLFQDFDLVFLVDNFDTFLCDHSWVDVFGQCLVHQLPDEGVYLYPVDSKERNSFGYLLQFSDGNRLDLTLAKKACYYGYCFDDRLSVVLLDKDGFLPPLPPPDESSHYIQKPCQAFFDECRCEFWWVSPYVSKGLWRGQLLFAQEHMELCIRKELRRMLSWLAGAEGDFSLSVGKCCDRLKEYLPPQLWESYLHTYAPCEEEALWQALFEAGKLFSLATQQVAQKLSFAYDNHWDIQVPKFLRYTKELPRDAQTMDY